MEHTLRCNTCNKEYATRKELTDHNSIMRRLGKPVGHEIQSRAPSVRGSQVDPKEKKKLDDFDVPNQKFIGLKQHQVSKTNLGSKNLNPEEELGFKGEDDDEKL